MERSVLRVSSAILASVRCSRTYDVKRFRHHQSCEKCAQRVSQWWNHSSRWSVRVSRLADLSECSLSVLRIGRMALLRRLAYETTAECK